MNSDDLAIPGL